MLNQTFPSYLHRFHSLYCNHINLRMIKVPDIHPTYDAQLRACLRTLDVLNQEVKEVYTLNPDLPDGLQDLVDATRTVTNALLVDATKSKTLK